MSVSAIFRRPGVGVIIMTGQPLFSVLPENAGMARPGVFARAAQEHATPAVHHGDTIAIQVRAGYRRAAPDAYVVGAVHPGAARTPIHEQVIVTAVRINV